MFGTPSLSARCDSVTTSRSASPFCTLTPPPTSTAYFSRKRRPGVVRRVSRMRVLVPLTAFANFAVWEAIPDRSCRKFGAVASVARTLTAGAETRATSWRPAHAMPSVARGSNVMFLSTSSKTRLKIGRPARTPSAFAISLPRAFTFPGNRDSLVRSPSPTSSASASLISLSTALIGNFMVTTGTAAGRGWGAGAGCGGGLGRGGIPGGRPAVRQGDPRPRMVGRGNGMMGTPGARGGWAGTGWTAGGGGARRAGLGAGWVGWAGGVHGGRAACGGLRATEDPFLAGSADLGRADFRVGFALTFEVVARPFAFERRTELRGALLLTRRCRSI